MLNQVKVASHHATISCAGCCAVLLFQGYTLAIRLFCLKSCCVLIGVPVGKIKGFWCLVSYSLFTKFLYYGLLEILHVRKTLLKFMVYLCSVGTERYKTYNDAKHSCLSAVFIPVSTRGELRKNAIFLVN